MTFLEALAVLQPPSEPRCPDPYAHVDCRRCDGHGWVLEARGPNTTRASCERCRGVGTEVCSECGDRREAVCACLVRPEKEPRALCWACFLAFHETGDVVRVVLGDAAIEFAMRDAMEVTT